MNCNLLEILHKNWGYTSFRPLQEDIIRSVLDGHDTLGLMPTGGGKSITFQVPALALGGLTIVVTPLISLMKDQVDNLRRRHIKGVALHTGMSSAEHRKAWELLTNGKASFLYVSPERLANDRFLCELKRIDVRLIVIDEAHCISQWGYDFRPSYLNIAVLRKVFPEAPVLALTATATPQVADDICRQLRFRSDARRFRMSFTRDNISYIVRPADNKLSELYHIISHTTGSAIVYVRSRKRTVEIAEWLEDRMIPAAPYHAAMPPDKKEANQNLWKSGAVRVIVATNAFGMGIDKPDVRVVIHYDLPPSLEEYYQEAGRAGRDGKPSYAVLLTKSTDKALMKRRITEAFPPRDTIRKVYERVCNNIEIALGEGYQAVKEFDIDRFVTLFKMQEKSVRSSLRILEQAGYMQFIEELENSARIRILTTKEELYSVRFDSPANDMILKTILRLYPGLFIDYVPINENHIAFNASLTAADVTATLIDLSRRKIISYIPKRRIPVIFLPTSREEPKYVRIGKDVWEERKERMAIRTEAMFDYAFNDGNCRVRRMLAYFGDQTEDCGKCDVCRDKRRKATRTPLSYSQAVRKIISLLHDFPHGLTLPLIEAHLGFRDPVIREAVNYLIAEEDITERFGLFKINS